MISSEHGVNYIALKGSVELMSEFFYIGINTILYQRGIYPELNFKWESKYGQRFAIINEPIATTYLQDQVLPTLKEFLERGVLQRVVLAVRHVESMEILERWQFVVEAQSISSDGNMAMTKEIEVVQSEMKAVMRQITSCNTLLPSLDNTSCAFEVLFYTDRDLEIPSQCEDCDAGILSDCEIMQLRSCSTNLHKVEVAVVYGEGKSC